MNKLFTIAAAATVAVGLSLSFAAPSMADDVGAGIAGGVLGFMAGAAVASQPHYVHPHHYVVDDGDDYYDHVQACRDAYGWRYSPRSDTYRARDGFRYPCDL